MEGVCIDTTGNGGCAADGFQAMNRLRLYGGVGKGIAGKHPEYHRGAAMGHAHSQGRAAFQTAAG